MGLLVEDLALTIGPDNLPVVSLSVNGVRHRSSVEPVLGSRLTLLLEAERTAAAAAEEAVLAEADRLEALLSVHRADSAFRRWRRGELPLPPRELTAVLTLARDWSMLTSGAFHPGLGAVVRRWRRAELDQQVPARDEMRALAQAAAVLPFDVVGKDVVITGDAEAVDVHGIAKGWIVDQLATRALTVEGVTSAVVDIGGDVRHATRCGAAPVAIAIEDPAAVADNARPLTVIRLGEGAVATSGGRRRGWTIAGRWFGHLLDPWTGWPLPHHASAAVVAATAAEADAAASAAVVLAGRALEAFADRVDVVVLRIADDLTTWRSPRWLTTMVEASVDGDPDHHDGEN